MTAIILSLAVALSPAAAPAASHDASCEPRWSSYRNPPTELWVFRLHRRGSSVPARVERWSLRDYVGAVAESGAWPAGKPMESLKVGVIAIRQYAWWMALHTCRRLRGRAYSITDSEQFLARGMRPGHRAHSRVRAAIDATWHVSLRKRGRLFRTGWTGGRVHDGWHLGEDSVTALASRGWGWGRIVRHLLAPVEVRP